MSSSKKIGVVYHGNREAKQTANLAEGRFAGIARALQNAGGEPVPAVYNDDFADEFLAQASTLDALLVWVNPITEGRDRAKLDATLKQLADQGVFVSAHPDTILKMGTKQVLFDTRDMAWGSDVRVYDTLGDLEVELPGSLAMGPRVLKQYRGHSGGGIWKVEADGDTVRVRHAERGSVEQTITFDDLLILFAPYFEGDGRMIDQEYQPRLTDGMIRCYLVIDEVQGFGHQAINALYPAPPGADPKEAPQPGPRLYYPPDKPEFQALKHRMETEFLPELLQRLNLTRDQLPLLWDADFLFGPKDENGNDTYVLCEINVSSVSPFPESAEAPLAEATMQRIASAELALDRLASIADSQNEAG